MPEYGVLIRSSELRCKVTLSEEIASFLVASTVCRRKERLHIFGSRQGYSTVMPKAQLPRRMVQWVETSLASGLSVDHFNAGFQPGNGRISHCEPCRGFGVRCSWLQRCRDCTVVMQQDGTPSTAEFFLEQCGLSVGNLDHGELILRSFGKKASYEHL